MSRSLCFHVRTYNRCDWIKIFSPNRGSSKKSVSLGACFIQQEELPFPIVQSFHSNFSNPLSVESWQAGCKPPKWSRAISYLRNDTHQWLYPGGQHVEKTHRTVLRNVFPQEMEALL